MLSSGPKGLRPVLACRAAIDWRGRIPDSETGIIGFPAVASGGGKKRDPEAANQ